MEKKCMREFDSILIRIVLANNIWVLSYIFSELRAVPCGRLAAGIPTVATHSRSGKGLTVFTLRVALISLPHSPSPVVA